MMRLIFDQWEADVQMTGLPEKVRPKLICAIQLKTSSYFASLGHPFHPLEQPDKFAVLTEGQT
jgi:hypothetical protein